MAVLSLDTLTGCSSIPSFLGGTSDTPANPSITLFHNSTAPTNWTKNTSASINDIALRVVGGAEGVGISTGGTLPFTTVFGPKATPLTVSPSPSGTGVDTSPSALSNTSTNANSSITVDNATVSVSQLPIHDHTYARHPGSPAPATTAPAPGTGPTNLAASATQSPQSTGPGDPGGASPTGTHTHTIQGSHTHPIIDPGHTHTFFGASQPNGVHTHTFTTTQDFTISYVDIIIATKD